MRLGGFLAQAPPVDDGRAPMSTRPVAAGR